MEIKVNDVMHALGDRRLLWSGCKRAQGSHTERESTVPAWRDLSKPPELNTSLTQKGQKKSLLLLSFID